MEWRVPFIHGTATEETIMKGYRTILVGLGLAIAPSALQYLGAVDWNAALGATGAFIVSGLIQVGMRFLTNTPAGQK